MSVVIERMRTDEADAVALLLQQALHFTIGPDQLKEWMERRGHEVFRVARKNGRLAAALYVIGMEQWFGGRSIPTAGVSAVGVAPEFRGTGVGAQLMRSMLAEQRGMGIPLSTLYPATTAFYRNTGFERAGSRTIYTIPTSALGIREHATTLIPVTPDEATFAALYERWAASQNGMLRRPSLMWFRRFNSYDGKVLAYLTIEADGSQSGYILYMQGNQQDPITVVDWCALTPGALRAMAQFLGNHGTMVPSVLWPGAPNDVFLHLLAEQKAVVRDRLDWMVRVLDVSAALQSRGYAANVEAEIHLDIEDAVLPQNHGRWVLQVRDGQAAVAAGGSGRVRLHIRDLAALFSSHMSPDQLRLIGSLSADPADLAALTAVFAGPQPWMPDMF